MVVSAVVVSVPTLTWSGTSVVAQTPEKVNLALDWIVDGGVMRGTDVVKATARISIPRRRSFPRTRRARFP